MWNGANSLDKVFRMKLRVGYEMIYDFPQPTPLIAVLGTHFTRASDVIVPDYLTTSPSVPITPYRDGFGNWCSRLVAPAGRMRLAADGTVLVNPGSPTMPYGYRDIIGTIGLLEVDDGRFEVSVIDLVTGTPQLHLAGPGAHPLERGPRPKGGR